MKPVSTLLAVLLAGILVGCAEEEPEVVTPPPSEFVQPKTLPNERVLSDFYKASGVNDPLPDNKQALMTSTTAQRLVKSANDLKRSSERAEDPEAVVNTAADLLAEKIKEAEAKNLWSFVGPLVEAYQVLRPDDKLYQPYAERAQRQLNRPKVALRGLYHDHTSGMTTASLKVYDPVTRETTTENIRLGEKYRGIKFTKIIGKDEGIELEIESTGTTFQVMKGGDLQ